MGERSGQWGRGMRGFECIPVRILNKASVYVKLNEIRGREAANDQIHTKRDKDRKESRYKKGKLYITILDFFFLQ